MYQNVYFDYKQNIIHCWDDTKGYYNKKFSRYAYIKDANGTYESIYGDKLRKVSSWKGLPSSDIFESDVHPLTRFLIDEYGESTEVSRGHIVCTIDIEVEMNTGLPDTKLAENQITSIALHDSATNDYYVFVVGDSTKEITIDNAYVKIFYDEAELLKSVIDKWVEINPSIVTGWNIDFFDIPYFYNRIVNVLGNRYANRLSPIGKVSYDDFRKRYFIAGISCLDYIELYKQWTYKELPNYRLDTVAKLELKRGKIEYNGNLDQLLRDDIHTFVKYNLVDVELVVELNKKLQFIDLARAVCHKGNVPYEDFIFSSRWLDGAILTYLKKTGRIAPNKPQREEKEYIEKKSADDKFKGAYVKQPIPGLYKWLYDLDLTSLYPSIIMTLNISPETKVGKIKNFSSDKFLSNSMDSYIFTDKYGNSYPEMTRNDFAIFLEKSNYTLASNGMLYDKKIQGVVSEILNVWFDERMEYQRLMNEAANNGNSDLKSFYDTRQLVQKIILNSLYGVLGLTTFRYYDIDNAEAVTITGQFVIKTTEKLINSYYNNKIGSDKDYIIYMDTDSVFVEAIPLVLHYNPNINVESDDEMIPKILDVASEIQSYINASYDTLAIRAFNIDTHRLIIKQETIAKSGFWVTKKRYAQWLINDKTRPCDKLNITGLDVKRSSFPKYFQEVMSTTLNSILHSVDKKEIDDIIFNYKSNMINQDFLSIGKNSAVKEISKYQSKNLILGKYRKGTPAHVKSAIAYNMMLKHYNLQTKYEPIKDGDKIKWIYLKQNPYGLNTMALTGYKDPDEIINFCKTYIDYDALWEAELDIKLNDFYSAMGWGICNVNLKTASKFFSF
jgi:DNA polymerase elongation subunit (family B)